MAFNMFGCKICKYGGIKFNKFMAILPDAFACNFYDGVFAPGVYGLAQKQMQFHPAGHCHFQFIRPFLIAYFKTQRRYGSSFMTRIFQQIRAKVRDGCFTVCTRNSDNFYSPRWMPVQKISQGGP